jgi:hypothetical protein
MSGHTLFGDAPKYATSDDVYSPPHVLERLGLTFDLDVCAPKGGLPWIPAERSLSIEDDGLKSDWHGRVWMNPPYSNVTPWVKKWLEHRNGVCLVPCSKSRWFRDLWQHADGMTYPTRPDGNPNLHWIKNGSNDYGIFMPVVLASMGEECTAALQAFGRVR